LAQPLHLSSAISCYCKAQGTSLFKIDVSSHNHYAYPKLQWNVLICVMLH